MSFELDVMSPTISKVWLIFVRTPINLALKVFSSVTLDFKKCACVPVSSKSSSMFITKLFNYSFVIAVLNNAVTKINSIMVICMFFVSHHLKILYSVVKRVIVYVMNHLTFKEFSPKVSFHNASMGRIVSTFYIFSFIFPFSSHGSPFAICRYII